MCLSAYVQGWTCTDAVKMSSLFVGLRVMLELTGNMLQS